MRRVCRSLNIGLPTACIQSWMCYTGVSYVVATARNNTQLFLCSRYYLNSLTRLAQSQTSLRRRLLCRSWWVEFTIAAESGGVSTALSLYLVDPTATNANIQWAVMPPSVIGWQHHWQRISKCRTTCTRIVMTTAFNTVSVLPKTAVVPCQTLRVTQNGNSDAVILSAESHFRLEGNH